MSYTGAKEKYWEMRIQEQLENDWKRTVRENKKELGKIYTQAQEELSKELLFTLEKMLADKASQDGLQVNDLYRTNRYYRLLDYFQELAKAIGEKQYTLTEEALIDAYNEAQSLVMEYVPQSLVQGRFLVPQAINAQQIVKQAWCADGKNFSDRIWTDKNKLLEDLPKILTDSVALGKSNFQIAAAMAERFATSEYNAFRLVKTETAHFQVKGKIDKYKTMGFTHGRYVGTKCCDECKRENGKLHTLDELEKLLPKHPNCTCTFILEINK